MDQLRHRRLIDDVPDGASDLIRAQASRLLSDFGLSPVTAAEIEFYLRGAATCATLASFWEEVMKRCRTLGVSVAKYEQERGLEQYEIALAPQGDPAQTALDVMALKDIVTQVAALHGMTADFSAKPFADQPGSGLHIHLHLQDTQGRNVFFKNDDRISDSLKHSIGGLLAWLPDCMPVFAPYPESYARFTAGSNAPVTASWGANNRTVAVRLPDKPHGSKHIEHRVAGADADPAAVMAVILAAVHDGLMRTLPPGDQMYGDAALPMYDLPPLPRTLEEARARFEQSAGIEKYFPNAGLLPLI